MKSERKRLLAEFIEVQCFKDDDGPLYRNDECYSVNYGKQIEHDTKMTKAQLREEMLALRNEGYVELMPCVNMDDGTPMGSGYFLTEDGLSLINATFTSDEIEKII